MKNDYFKKVNKGKNDDLVFMEFCEKSKVDEFLNKPCHILGYGICEGKDGTYSIIRTDLDDSKFFFGGTVVTDKLQRVDKDEMHNEIKKETVKFTRVESKNGRSYVDMEIL